MRAGVIAGFNRPIVTNIPVQIEPVAFYTMENVSGLTPGSTIFDELGNYDAITPSAIQTLPGAIGNALSVGPWQSSGIGVIDTGLIRNPSKPIALSAFVRIPPVGQTYEETHSATSVVTFADGVGDPATFMYATIKAGWVGGTGVDEPLTLQVYMYGQFSVIPLPEGLTAGDYCHVVINASAMDASTLWVRAWFNGVRIIDRSGGNANAISTTTSVKFGGKHLAGYGEIDHVKIFEAELTDDYVLGLYDEYVPPAPSITWYDVPLGGVDNAFVAGQFNNTSIDLPGSITGATKVRLVGTWEGTYASGDLTIWGYSGGSGGSHDLRMSYEEFFATEDWSGTIDVVIPIKPTAGEVDGEPGLYGYFLEGSNIDHLYIVDGVETGITGINVKLQIDVPFTVDGGGGGGTDVNLWSQQNFLVSAMPYGAGSSFNLAPGVGDDSWLSENVSRHKSSAFATPNSLYIDLSGKKPAYFDITVDNFERLAGYESDETAKGHLVVSGVDGVVLGYVEITANGVHRAVLDWVTWSTSSVVFIRIDTTGQQYTQTALPGDHIEKVRFDITGLAIDGIDGQMNIWHHTNWSTTMTSDYGTWDSDTVYLVYEYGGGNTWEVAGSWAVGLRPTQITVEFDRHGSSVAMEVKIYQGAFELGSAINTGEQFTVIDIVGQTADITSLTTSFAAAPPELYAIVGIKFTY